MRKIHLLGLALIALTMSFVSCEKDITDDKPVEKTLYNQGVLVLNEGGYMANNASVSFITESNDKVVSGIFSANNKDMVLGDVLQSAVTNGENTYLVLNGSNKVEVVKTEDFKSVATIDGLIVPRYAAIVGEKLYVTEWKANTVSVVNLSNNTKESSIAVGTDPEGIIAVGEKLVVANSGGSQKVKPDSTISVINTSTNKVEKTIEVGYSPREMVLDANNDIWVLCTGYTQYDTITYDILRYYESSLTHIDGETFEVIKNVKLHSKKSPMHLDINKAKDVLYYGCGYGYEGIFEFPITATEKNKDALMGDFFYGFNVNPENGDIYCGIAPDFKNNGKVKIFNSEGVEKKEFEAGIGPNGFYFPMSVK